MVGVKSFCAYICAYVCTFVCLWVCFNVLFIGQIIFNMLCYCVSIVLMCYKCVHVLLYESPFNAINLPESADVN